jgi:hypothetical protein
MRTAELEQTGATVKIGGRVIKNLRYTTTIADDLRDLKILLNKIKYASGKPT